METTAVATIDPVANADGQVDAEFDAGIEAAFEMLAARQLAKKRCPICNFDLPLIPSVFRPDPEQPDGFSALCASCDVQQQQKLIETCVAEVNQTVDIGMHGRSLRLAGRASDQDVGVPHLRVVYQRMLEVFGGPEGLAAAKAATFIASPKGSMQRVKILDGLDRMSAKVTETGGADLDLERMTPDQLADQKQRIEERMRSQMVAASAEAKPVANEPTGPIESTEPVTEPGEEGEPL